jgi:3-phosphoshikimate 1-carboxyvinyltransferase
LAALKVAGSIRVPGDKSISHRSLILASLAEGESRIRGILEADDIRSTAEALRSLGAEIPALSNDMRLTGVGLRGFTAPRQPLNCGNSGTTARLMAGVVAAYPFAATFEGDKSLSRRPMKRIAEPLTYMGAHFDFEHGDGLPMTVRGMNLRTIDWNTGASSAQVKSAILLAGVVAAVEVRVTETSRSRDHTERMLRAMGVDVENNGTQVRLRPSKHLTPIEMEVAGDASSAAFFIALASLATEGRLTLTKVGLNPTRTGFIEAMKRMGAEIEERAPARKCGEATGTLEVRPAKLRGIRIMKDDVPSLIDELPLLACVAAGAGVDLEITGAAELRVKESDRINAVVQNLRAVGAQAEELPDGLRVSGSRRELAGTIDPRGDHRVAMAFGVLSAASGNGIKILNPECVSVSYPAFWEELGRVTTAA